MGNEKISVLMNGSFRGSALVLLLTSWVLAVLVSGSAHAQVSAMGVNSLDGGRYVGSARTDGRGLRAATDLGYAHTDNVLGSEDHHERIFGDLSAGYILQPWLQLAADFNGRYDLHRGPQAHDQGFALSTTLTGRTAFAVNEKLSFAGQLDLLFPAAKSAKQGFTALTPSFSALATYRLWDQGEITGLAGYRLNRTEEALNGEQLSGSDAIGSNVSKFDQVLVGTLFSAPIGPVTTVGELSWDVNIGEGAPSIARSPLRLRAAVQTLLAGILIPSFEFGALLTDQPNPARGATIEPSFWLAGALGIALDKRKEEPPPEEKPAPVVAAPPAPVEQTGSVSVQVTDSELNALPDAAVRISAGEKVQEARTDVVGYAKFTVVRGERLTLKVEMDGYHPVEKNLTLKNAEGSIRIPLERALPEGQIKGNVRSLRGGPLQARIEILTTGQVVDTAADGTFVIDVPPGDYRLRISADGHEPQERSAQVERLGVTILVVDLRRTTK